ncbi:MAG: hypothetical protein HY720_14380, partial [Planctomycetes bacterium]|nr:hypothetical protein [Planctomycetota bacterium]
MKPVPSTSLSDREFPYGVPWGRSRKSRTLDDVYRVEAHRDVASVVVEIAYRDGQEAKLIRVPMPSQQRIDFYRKELGTRELFIYQPLGKNQEDGYLFFFFRLRAKGPDEEIEPGEDGWYRSEIL